ncbi:hypothetical protein [Staphylothermus marinus]|uniref:hypothetical protein n=1 Tax=Staphylothermus marinus TaxID=2280 RepID=UPI0011E50741|nr:hypothetical protein [Staphylothermus marinus]
MVVKGSPGKCGLVEFTFLVEDYPDISHLLSIVEKKLGYIPLDLMFSMIFSGDRLFKKKLKNYGINVGSVKKILG